MSPDVYYVQLLYGAPVDGADDDGWITVAVGDDRMAAYRRAAHSYRRYRHPQGGSPMGVRVLSERELRERWGDAAVRQAGAGLAAMIAVLGPGRD